MVMMMTGFAVLAPQLALYYQATGRFLVSSMAASDSTLRRPDLGVLFSVQKGVFFWSPLLLAALAGLVWGPDWPKRAPCRLAVPGRRIPTSLPAGGTGSSGAATGIAVSSTAAALRDRTGRVFRVGSGVATRRSARDDLR